MIENISIIICKRVDRVLIRIDGKVEEAKIENEVTVYSVTDAIQSKMQWNKWVHKYRWVRIDREMYTVLRFADNIAFCAKIKRDLKIHL